jgi:hypothetical protein
MKQVLWFTSFFALLVAGDRLGGLWLQKQVDKSQFRYSRMYRGDAGADILLVGNSRGLTFYEPYIASKSGLKTFNLSYNGLPMDLSKVLVQDYLEKYPAPKVMVIDITGCDRTNDALLSGFLCYTHDSRRIDTLIQRKLSTEWRAGRLTALYRYNNEVFQRALYHRNRSDSDWLLDRVISDKQASEAEKNSYDLELHPYLIQQLTEMVETAKGKGIQVQLVISPYLPGFKVKNLDQLKDAAQQATGLPVRDYRAALTDKAFFGDFMHPNKAGAMRYLDLLRADGVLP